MSNNTLFELSGYGVTLTHVLLLLNLLVFGFVAYLMLTFRKKLWNHIDSGFSSVRQSLQDFEPHLDIGYEDIMYLNARAEERRKKANDEARRSLEQEARAAEAKAAGLRNDLKGLDIQASWRNPRGR